MADNEVYVVEELVEGQWRKVCAFINRDAAERLVDESERFMSPDRRVVVYTSKGENDESGD